VAEQPGMRWLTPSASSRLSPSTMYRRISMHRPCRRETCQPKRKCSASASRPA
jgi:hypothetical protein